jgi:molybdenum cofactor cytidylyltransferase
MNPIPHPGLGVIILGAGASVRMGKPKLLLPWRDTTVIGQIVSTWRELSAAQIAIVMRPDDTSLSAELDRLGLTGKDRIENPQPEQGMFSSILCAANWPGWKTGISGWAIVLGDQPQLSAQALRPLVALHAQNLEQICQPAVGTHAGHPVILSKAAFEALGQARTRTLKDFLKEMTSACVHLKLSDPGVLLDLDTPEDYTRLNQLTHEKSRF